MQSQEPGVGIWRTDQYCVRKHIKCKKCYASSTCAPWDDCDSGWKPTNLLKYPSSLRNNSENGEQWNCAKKNVRCGKIKEQYPCSSFQPCPFGHTVEDNNVQHQNDHSNSSTNYNGDTETWNVFFERVTCRYFFHQRCCWLGCNILYKIHYYRWKKEHKGWVLLWQVESKFSDNDFFFLFILQD